MRKFKHKPTGNIYETYGHPGCIVTDNNASTSLPLWITENSLDWEEIVEKEYEILSFTPKNNKKCIYTEKESSASDWKKYNIPNSGHDFLEIHSIKRINDGEIFTIGDMVKAINKTSKIESFIFVNKLILTAKLDKVEFPASYSLVYLNKTKPKLFTTEDGVDIFKGDTFYWLDKGLNIGNSGYSKIYTNIINTLYFSTKEKAEEYILMNKRCLSINDIIKNTTSYNSTELRKLVKTKI